MKILLLDVECSPNIAYIWAKYEQNALGDFIKERQVISFAWKWLGEKDVHVLALPDFKGYKKNPDDNKALIMRMYELVCQADLIVGHNLDLFDDKIANTEFLLLGLQPPPPHKTVCTLKAARHNFYFNSNKLGDLGFRLGFGKKVDTGGFELWAGCMRGDPKSWLKMKKYNKGDVVLLEKIYLRIRPWMKGHPNVNALDGHVGCPTCRGVKLQRRGWQVVGNGRRQRFQCQNSECGKWSKGALVKKEIRFT